MAIKTINENYLSAIGDAIRSKNGKNEKYKPKEMAAAIEAMEFGGVQIPLITGNCSYRFAYNGWSWAFPYITTSDITNCNGMFIGCDNYLYKGVPFEINCKPGTSINLSEMFYGATFLLQIEGAPKINNCKPSSMKRMFGSCVYLTEIPADYFVNWDFSDTYGDCSGMFNWCRSLRSILSLAPFGAIEPANATNTSGCKYPEAFKECVILDEIANLPISETQVSNARTTNMFVDTFYKCNRLKKLTFKEPGKVVKWKNQRISLIDYVGYGETEQDITRYGFDYQDEKKVSDNITYQSLKNDPDYWTIDIHYSRYNKESAIATINSLPDTSAYIAENGGTNTILFKGDAGLYTDGGAIKNLTEAQIAVAAAKGWTVSLI